MADEKRGRGGNILRQEIVNQGKSIKGQKSGTLKDKKQRKRKGNEDGEFRIFGTQIRKFLRDLREVRGR